ncbi:Uncharacterised protein [Streptococcus pneumoniae]|uniref:hypothetical protein n=1 Tax=Bacilli TaxID=91061 RepID=UPI0005E80245|nr:MULTISPECIES: hypothetical protein [Bacilli]CKE76367.1 Uncharacterised protein [Streptococcus pneumoniae]CKE78877.1 Uncharacterised protein [Streptococcus pneumoniae]CKE88467.1 Uncharacterised protein [Streptococcus pneumoniae]CKF07958.1 Uncharacterised protein [Streptococcus pneumoniae]CKF16895.1 Uncharacterised protein [Streptococcus pneumoniae]
MDELKEVVQVSIKTNERDIEFTSFAGLNQIKQSLDGEVSSVVLTDEELELVLCVRERDKLASFFNSVLQRKNAV